MIVYVEGAIAVVKSGVQKSIILSTTEAEIIALVQCVQGMIYIMKLIVPLRLKD